MSVPGSRREIEVLHRGGALGLVLCALAAALASPLVSAQAMRDPTLAPPEARPAVAASTAAAASAARAATDSVNVIVREGQPHVAVGTRLYRQGDTLGQARIERITETEIWLREGGVLRKVPRFAGVERRVALPDCLPAPPPAPAASDPATVPAVTKAPRVARAKPRQAEKTASPQIQCNPVGP